MRDRYSEFQERGAEVIAIAPDTLDNARRYFETLFARPAVARETTCRSRGDRYCTFELELHAA